MYVYPTIIIILHSVIPELVDIEDIRSIKQEIGSLPKLQKFRCSDSCIDAKYRQYKEHTDEEFEEFVKESESI